MCSGARGMERGAGAKCGVGVFCVQCARAAGCCAASHAARARACSAELSAVSSKCILRWIYSKILDVAATASTAAGAPALVVVVTGVGGGGIFKTKDTCVCDSLMPTHG